MKISYNWLREYVATDASPEEVAETLTMGALEVEGIERIGSDLNGIVVGRVLAVRPHPNAERLTLCDVDLGGGEAVQIVCGAPNVAAGRKVPVATIGTTLMLPSRDRPEERVPVEIRKSRLRGEVSEGMICAEDELGFSDDHTGIMLLEDSAEVGKPLAEHLRKIGREAADAILDVSITPNRPDAASHLGVARDVAALTGSTLTTPEIDLPDAGDVAPAGVTVEILSPQTCPRYVAMVVRGVTVGESPAWLKGRLSAIGLRPRNNVVDVTNFVLHEIGQPLHAFDLDELAGRTIRVRLTESESTFRTLDGKDRILPAGTTMIADGERDVAIAGVMGGENSEVTDQTTNVLIESAYFDPTSVRKAARALGLQTDASYRFERGVDHDGQVWAAARAARLIAALGGGEIVDGFVDAHVEEMEDRVIKVRSSRIDGLLGVRVPVDEAGALLEAIGFGVEVRHPSDGETVLVCTVPTYRPDVEREVDVIEEVVRLYGFDRIPELERTKVPSRIPRDSPEDRLKRSARALLSGMGFRETYTNSMMRREMADLFADASSYADADAGDVVETLNPISQEMAALRPSLAAGALQVMSFNRKHGRRMLRFFEFGHVYRKNDRIDAVIPGYVERESLIITACGPAAPGGWDVDERPVDLFDLKGTVAALFESLRLPDLRFEPHEEETNVTKHHLTIHSGETRVGILARLTDSLAGDFDLTGPAYFAEIDWSSVVDAAAPHLERRYRPISRYPVVERDLAVVVDREQPAGPLLDTIRVEAGSLLQSIDVFDQFVGEAVGEGKKNIAFSLRFGADRTLLDEEVDERMEAVVEALATRHGAVLRG